MFFAIRRTAWLALACSCASGLLLPLKTGSWACARQTPTAALSLGAGTRGGWLRLTATVPVGCDFTAAGHVEVQLNRTLTGGGGTLSLSWPALNVSADGSGLADALAGPAASLWLPAEAGASYAASVRMWWAGGFAAAPAGVAGGSTTAWSAAVTLDLPAVGAVGEPMPCSADGLVASAPSDAALNGYWAAAWGAVPPPAAAVGFVRVYLAGFAEYITPASMVRAHVQRSWLRSRRMRRRVGACTRRPSPRPPARPPARPRAPSPTPSHSSRPARHAERGQLFRRARFAFGSSAAGATGAGHGPGILCNGHALRG